MVKGPTRTLNFVKFEVTKGRVENTRTKECKIKLFINSRDLSNNNANKT